MRRTEIVRDNSPVVRTVITGYRNAPYVDVSFSVNLKAFEQRSGRVAVAFPVDTSEQLWLDGAGFVYRVPQDMLPGGSASQFAAVSFVHSGRAGAPGRTIASRDSALVMRDGTFLLASQGLRTETRDEGTQWLERTEPRGSEIQTFRFRMVSQPDEPAEWKRFGQELNLPLQAATLGATDLRAEQSFLTVSQSNVIVSAFKAAEHDAGWSVIRLQEIGGAPAEVQVTSAFRVLEAVYANTVERRTKARADLSRIPLKPWQTVTLLARLEQQTP
jgi:alpha-mannosidase